MEWRVLKVLAGYVLAATRQTSLLFAILMAASVGVTLAAVLLGLKIDPVYFWGLGSLLPLAIVGGITYRRMTAQRMLDRLRDGWGRGQDRKRVFPMIESLYQYRQSSPQEDAAPLDEQTWNDLNMSDVYAKIDRTLTNPGECVLYQMLRTPLLSPSELQRRRRIIRLFQTDRAIREGGVTITGSNMAGQTTFLRTFGVNVVLAQTVCTCLASSYEAGPFRIFSLINDADSLLEGKSYYLVQAEHLLKMVRSCEKAGRTLCLIDEPLAGTNSSERSAAAFEILQYLVRHNAMVVLATHDLELAQRLGSTLKNYYFLGRVTDKGLEFDFRLKMGITPTRNAIDLLRYLGFPRTIVERAVQQVS